MPKRHRSKRDGPGPADAFVGRQIRDCRISLGLSLIEFAPHLGLSPQQLQKYEQGVHRIYASRLWALSQAFGIPVKRFFEGFGEAGIEQEDVLTRPGARQLIKYYSACPASTRNHLRALIKATADMSEKLH